MKKIVGLMIVGALLTLSVNSSFARDSVSDKEVKDFKAELDGKVEWIKENRDTYNGEDFFLGIAQSFNTLKKFIETPSNADCAHGFWENSDWKFLKENLYHLEPVQ